MERTLRGLILALCLGGTVTCGAVACGGGGGGGATPAGAGGDGVGTRDGAVGDGAVGGDGGSAPGCPVGAPGDVLWTFAAGREIRGTPAVDAAGNVYVATMDFTIVSIDCRGAERWRWRWECDLGAAPCPHAFSAPLALHAGGGAVLSGDVLLALGTDGVVAWESDQMAAAGNLDAAPAVGPAGELFVGSRSIGADGSAGRLFGLDAGGALRTGFPVDLQAAVESGPAVKGDVVYVAHAWREDSAAQRYTLAVSALGFDGAPQWSAPLADAAGFPYGTRPPSSLAFDSAGRVLVVVSRVPADGAATQTHLLRLNALTGEVVQETRLTAADCTGACAPIVRGAGADEEIFVASSWQGLIDRVLPAQADSLLFIDPNFPGCRDCRAPSPAAGDDGLLYLIGGATGAMEPGAPPLALYPVDRDESGRSVIAGEYPFRGQNEADNVSTAVQIGPDGVAYVGTRAGVVVAIRTAAGGLDPAAPWPAVRHDAANTGRGR